MLAIWGIGTSIWMLVLAVGLLRLRRWTRRAHVSTRGPWVDAAERLTAAAGGRAFEIRETPRPVLLVWGVRRSTILVPRTALAWPAERIAAVLQHELAHIRRRDWAVQVFAEVVRAAYWFNPLVWIACARLRTTCEIACDDIVVGQGMESTTYAAHIVTIARELKARFWVPAPAIVRSSTLERRVKAMLDPSRDRRPMSSVARRTVIGAAAALALAVATVAAQQFVSMSGTIVDPSQGVLPGVTLVLTNERTEQKYEIRTDRSGRYEFVGLPPGDYSLAAALPGFARFNGRVVVGTQNVQQDVVLAVGSLQETITVVGSRTGQLPPPAPDADRERRIEEIRAKFAAQKCPERQPGLDARIGGNLRPPLKLVDKRPVFPDHLIGVDAVVQLDARIGPDGRVEDVEVVASPNADFSNAAITAVRQWEFTPTLLNCAAVPVHMQVSMTFKTQ
jgi:TonB family protein